MVYLSVYILNLFGYTQTKIMTNAAMQLYNSIILNHIYYLSIFFIFTLIDYHLLWVQSCRHATLDGESDTVNSGTLKKRQTKFL